MGWNYARHGKFNAVRKVVNGISFASKREAARYQELLLQLAARKITDLTLQPSFKFDCGIVYKADFSYIENQKRIYEDTKGFKTPVFNMKMKMFKHHFPLLELRITK